MLLHHISYTNIQTLKMIFAKLNSRMEWIIPDWIIELKETCNV